MAKQEFILKDKAGNVACCFSLKCGLIVGDSLLLTTCEKMI